MCRKKFFETKNLKKILAIFLYLKKKIGSNSVNFRKKKLKKILKIIFAIFLFLKKSVKSRLIHQSKDRKLSVNLG